MACNENTLTAENYMATCCNSLPFSHIWSVPLLLGTAGEYCLCGCSNAVFPCLFHCHFPSHCDHHVSFLFQSISPPLPSPLLPLLPHFSLPRLPSHSLTALTLPSLPPLLSPPLPFFPEHVPDPEVPCSVGCPNPFIAGNRLLRKIAQARK